MILRNNISLQIGMFTVEDYKLRGIYTVGDISTTSLDFETLHGKRPEVKVCISLGLNLITKQLSNKTSK